jgi:macrolide transport system ATP-binding/permease protein
MKWARAWAVRLAGLFGKRRNDREISAELESHLDLHITDNIKGGMTPEQARREAMLKLGGVVSVKEALRDRNTAPALEHFVIDSRFALRQLRKNPGFALTAIVVLALGMCASIAIFAFVDASLINPVPFAEPSKLVAVTETAPGFGRANLSYQDYLDWKKLNSVFTSLDVYTGDGFLLDTPAGAEPAPAARVSAGFFRTLGVNPALGRDFLASEEAPGAPHVVMMTYGTWQKRFGGKEDIVGQSVRLSGEAYTVVGVLPDDFHFAQRGNAEFWVPFDVTNGCLKRRSCHNLNGIARLKDGVTIDAAQANMAVIAKRLEDQYPDSNRQQGASVISAAEEIAGQIRPILMVLMGGAGLLLLIACVNVAGLLLVRSEGRRREMAVRGALGASFTRQVTQFVTESLVLVLAGSGLSLVFAGWAMTALKSLIPATMLAYMPYLLHLGLNSRVLVYAGAVTALALLLFSFTPVLHLSSSRLQDSLAEGSRGSAGRAWQRLGSRLVVVELATAMVLLVAAGLFGKSLYQLLKVELGFQPDQLATVTVAAPDISYHKDEQSIALGRDLVRAVSALPGIEGAAIASTLPANFNGNTDWIRFVGKPYDGKHIEVNERDVSADYFRTIGAKLVRGRYFTDAEDESKAKVVVINETLANRYFPNENPVGQQIGDTELKKESLRTIVGVVGDIREGALDEDLWPAQYHPFNQDPGTYFSIIVRASQNPGSVMQSVVTAIHKSHPDVGTSEEATMKDRINISLAAYLRRTSAWLVGGFAFMALLLGVVGLYGVIAHSVSQRTREIGVRMAMGAQQSNVYRMILSEAGWLVALGIGVGAVASVSVALLARKLLFGVSSWDVPTLLMVAVVLGLAALAASFLPAKRAASVNPMDALRAE